MIDIFEIVAHVLILLDLPDDVVYQLPFAKVDQPIDVVRIGIIRKCQVRQINTPTFVDTL